MTQNPTRNPATPEQEWVTLARVVRPRGLRGEVFAEILTDFPERFRERRQLYLRAGKASVPRGATLEEHRLHQGRLLLKFEGVDSVDGAELLRGHEVVIPRDERAPLDEDSVYIGDLVGCVLYDRALAEVVGEIVDVDRESSNTPLIVVRAETLQAGSEELLIPFAKAYLPEIDLEARRMEMTLPEGLLGVNGPLSEAESSSAAKSQQEHPDGLPRPRSSAAAAQQLGRQQRRRK